MSTSETDTPRKCPVSIIVVGALFIAVGLLDIWLGVSHLTVQPVHLASDNLLVMCIGIVALLGSIHLLKGRDWGRWVLVAWMALHVALSTGQLHKLLIHLGIFALMLAGLFHPAASAYFRRRED